MKIFVRWWNGHVGQEGMLLRGHNLELGGAALQSCEICSAARSSVVLVDHLTF